MPLQRLPARLGRAGHGVVEVQLTTLDDAEALPPGANIQTAEQLSWMGTAHGLLSFARFPE